jgi:hypothetical protein
MKTFLISFYGLMLIFFLLPVIGFSQKKDITSGLPRYIKNPNSDSLIKRTFLPRNNQSPLSECQISNTDAITFDGFPNYQSLQQHSPDIPIRRSNPWSYEELTSEPSIVVDPMNKNNILTGSFSYYPNNLYIDNDPLNGIDIESSTQNGQNWFGGVFPNELFDYPIPLSNPAVGIYHDDNSNILYCGSTMLQFNPDGSPDNAWKQVEGVSYSTDGGNNWTQTIIADILLYIQDGEYEYPAYYLDRNHLAIDNNTQSPFKGRVYSAWTPNATLTFLEYNNFGVPDWGQIDLTYSSDGINWPYNTYSTITSTMDSPNNPGNVFNDGVNIQTGLSGEVYAVWAMYPATDQNGYDHPPNGAEFALGFTKSIDGGNTFDKGKIIQNIEGIHDNQDFLSNHGYTAYSFPVMCVDKSKVHPGRIYVAWSNKHTYQDQSTTYFEIYTISSDDNGATWSSKVMVDNVSLYAFQKFSVSPWIACDNETGTVCVTYYDDRNFQGYSQFDTYVSMSRDGGITWQESKSENFTQSTGNYGGIDDYSFCSTPVYEGVQPYFNFYNGISVKDGIAYPAWTSNEATYDDPNESQPFTVISPYYIWNCVDHYDPITEEIGNGGVIKYEVSNYIHNVSQEIESGGFAFYDAGLTGNITIVPGFHAEQGSYIHAYLDGCTPFNSGDGNYRYYSGSTRSKGNQDNNILKAEIYEKLIKAFPNPTTGNFTVQLGDISGTNNSLILTNSMDEQLLQISPSANTNYQINLTDYPKGIYFIKLFTADRNYINKVILQ